MRIALVQMELEHKNKNRNIIKIIESVKKAKDKNADIVVFPELTYTGYLLSEDEFREYSETLDGYFARKIKSLSRDNNINIIAGYAEKEGENLYNSVLFTDRDGNILMNYRKQYLWKKEKKTFKSGENLEIVDTEFGKIGMLICYDMEFPEPSRELAKKGADIIFAPSCFSKRAEKRWDLLLNANALFNLVYVIGVNVVDKYCCGKSKIISPLGESIIELSKEKEDFKVIDIDISLRKEIMKKIPYIEDIK